MKFVELDDGDVELQVKLGDGHLSINLSKGAIKTLVNIHNRQTGLITVEKYIDNYINHLGIQERFRTKAELTDCRQARKSEIVDQFYQMRTENQSDRKTWETATQLILTYEIGNRWTNQLKLAIQEGKLAYDDAVKALVAAGYNDPNLPGYRNEEMLYQCLSAQMTLDKLKTLGQVMQTHVWPAC